MSRSKFFRPCGMLFFSLQLFTLAACAASFDAASGIKGVITISPSCAGATKSNEPCVKPFANAPIRLKKTDGQIVSTVNSAADGKFEIQAGPGLYDLQIEIDGEYPRCETVTVKVKKGRLSEVNLECDSGMR